MCKLQVRFLGTFDIRCGDQRLPSPPTLKSQSLLAYLICHRRQPTSRERLAELFWGDRPDVKARHSLATALWQIRRCLSAGESVLIGPEDIILSDSRAAQFDPRTELWLDTEAFESLIARHEVAALESAVALYQGDFLDGFYDDWIINERYRLQMLFHSALAQLMIGQEGNGDIEDALQTALRLLRDDPLREDAHRLVMRAYCHLGQRNTALDQYRRCRALVQADLSAEPTLETKELHRAILEGRYPVGGIPGPASSLQVVARPPIPSGRNPLDAGAPSRLVGREDELGFLQNCWQEAVAAMGRVVLLSGEAGVGKTRLVQEFADQLRWQGSRVLWGQCYEFERDLPYQPVAEALAAIPPTLTAAELERYPAQVLRGVARLVPEILQRLPDLAVAAPEDPDRAQATLFGNVADFLSHLSSREPLLFVFEDLHWAGASTLEMLHYAARHLAGCRVLILGTLREEAVGRRHPLVSFRAEMRREGLARQLRLARLPAEAVQAVVAEMSGAGESVVPLARRLYIETEGNPFFLMEMVRALFEAELIHLDGGIWQGDWGQLSQRALPMPANLREAIQSRVDTLPDDVQKMLRLAAVLGREFDFDLLSHVWGRSEQATLEALDICLRHRLLEEGIGAVGRDYAFAHHKIQEVLYGSIPRRHRLHAHAQVGDAMESLYGTTEREALAGELAHHFERGCGSNHALTEKAVGYLLQAGDGARQMYAHQEAIDYYERAQRLLERQGAHERAALVSMRLGLTYHNAFDYEQARQAWTKGFGLSGQAIGGQRTALAPATHPLRLSWVEPTTLDVARFRTHLDKMLLSQMFSGLVELGPNMEVLPDVARHWEVLDGGRKYVFHLRDDVVWSDGVPVTAHDFELAWTRVLYEVPDGIAAYHLCDIKGAPSLLQSQVTGPDRVGVRTIDERTLLVELEAPAGYFLYLLANCLNWPAPCHAIQHFGEAWAEPGNLVTNGPFQLSDWKPGLSMALSRNPRYHGRWDGNVQQVELTFVPQGETRTTIDLYEAGQLDCLWLWLPPPPEVSLTHGCHPGESRRVPRLATFYVAFDPSRPPFDDIRVRRAFVSATDRESLASIILRGHEAPATGGFVPPGMPGFSPGIGLPYDPDQASRLLSNAGFPGGRGFPAVSALAAQTRLPYIEYLSTAWRELLGVNIRWDLLDSAPEHRLREESPDIFAWGWLADYPDPDSFLRTSTIPAYIGWRNETCELLVEQARRIMDHKKRMSLYAQAERILAEEARIMPLTYGASHLLVKPWVRHYPASALDTQSWKDVILEPRF